MAPPDDPGNPTVNFHGESRRNDTHQSTTDPEPEARTDLDLLPDAWLEQSSASDGDSAAVTEGTTTARDAPPAQRLDAGAAEESFTDEELTGLLDAVQPQSHLPSAWLPRSLVCPPDGR
jgi:hypothetical protein